MPDRSEPYGTEQSGFAPEPELDLGLTPAPPSGSGRMITVRQSDVAAILAECFHLSGQSQEWHRLAQAAGIAR